MRASTFASVVSRTSRSEMNTGRSSKIAGYGVWSSRSGSEAGAIIKTDNSPWGYKSQEAMMRSTCRLQSDSSRLAKHQCHSSKMPMYVFTFSGRCLSQSGSRRYRIARLSDPHQTTQRCGISRTDDTSSAKTNVTAREQIHCRCRASRRRRTCTQWCVGSRERNGYRPPLARRRYSRSHEQSGRRPPLARRDSGTVAGQTRSLHGQARSNWGAPTSECEGSTGERPGKRPSPVHEEVFGSE